MKGNRSYEFHLAVREASISPGTEWGSRFSDWLLLQVTTGTGYFIHPKQTLQLEPGSVLVLPPDAEGSVRSSQVGVMSFCFFCVDPVRLMGLLTMAEHAFFGAAAAKDVFFARMLPGDHPVAAQLQDVFLIPKRAGILLRLRLLQSFLEAFGDELKSTTEELKPSVNAKQRLSEFLNNAQTSELINLSFSELVEVSRCTRRHLSRIFREVVGMSFRDKQAELRLTMACDLLARTELKIVDIALESGFQSLSLFNLMFGRRLGMSPGTWRQNHRDDNLAERRGTRKRALAVVPLQQ